MRIAIVSDVHGNLAALEAVVADLRRAAPDLVVHGGDLALNGPRPAECVDRIRELGWPGVVGNTDQALWWMPPGLPEHTVRVFARLVERTAELLGEERIGWLRGLPSEWRREDRVALVHAVPGDTWKGVLPDAPDQELERHYRPLGAALAVYGHVHRPYVRRLSGLTVANSGSVGLPYDGDPRPSYLLVTDGEPEVRRVAYDVERHLRDLESSGYPSAGWLATQARTAAGGFPRLDEG
ncbi:MAG TPA: metallophosphoesterase family protein [Candidatus Dormibacteraeota bacterium]|jgi:putative phosphoesterase|nr:metallophosphoesterase family protein [Candidatus Dormibacteraeota bacterium]